jgi:hypothetical protein
MRAILPAMMTSSSLLFRLAVGVALCWPAISARASAAEPLGTITRVENKAARVEELQGTPAVGALAQVFVVVPGLEEEAQVATAVVTKVADKHVEIRIDQATAPVEAGQLVRFRGAPAAAPRAFGSRCQDAPGGQRPRGIVPNRDSRSPA